MRKAACARPSLQRSKVRAIRIEHTARPLCVLTTLGSRVAVYVDKLYGTSLRHGVWQGANSRRVVIRHFSKTLELFQVLYKSCSVTAIDKK